MSEELICPHCGEIQKNFEASLYNICLTQCEKCGKDFWYSVGVTRDYDSWEEDEE